MKSGKKIVIGFIVGLVAYHLFVGDKPRETAPAVVADDIAVIESPTEPAAPETQQPEKTPSQTQPRLHAVQPDEQAVPLARPFTVKEKVEISLSETLVQQMEEQWRDLPLFAEANKELRGWRIVRVEANSVFARAGLRVGDLITTEFLLDLARVFDQSNLASRVEQILNRITR